MTLAAPICQDRFQTGSVEVTMGQTQSAILRPIIVAALVCLAPISSSSTENYPNHPIKLVVPVAAGGAPDIVSRIVAEKLSAKLRQPVTVENRPGAGERLGAEFVAKSPPDGYTLLSAPPGSLLIAPLLYSHIGYEPSAFVPVTVLTTGHLVLVARPNFPASDLKELIAFAKANPGKLTYASPGIGTPPHLTGEMLKAAARIETTHVPYKGLAPALTDLLAGHVDFMFDNLGNSLSYIRDGRVKVFGIASGMRIAELPDTPAISESYPAVRSTSWFAVVAPPQTPPEIAKKLSSAIAETLRLPDVVRRLHELSFTPVGNSPTEMAAFLKEESERWRSVVFSAGIKPE